MVPLEEQPDDQVRSSRFLKEVGRGGAWQGTGSQAQDVPTPVTFQWKACDYNRLSHKEERSTNPTWNLLFTPKETAFGGRAAQLQQGKKMKKNPTEIFRLQRHYYSDSEGEPVTASRLWQRPESCCRAEKNITLQGDQLRRGTQRGS